MKRLALEKLDLWGKKHNRRPLLIRGARQVGKTWLVREYAKGFSSFVELNLESHPEYHSLFSDLYGKPKELISAISLLANCSIIPGQTLLFIDEIQECSNALLSLRYFKENLPELHVIAAGSLLEFAIKELSFPVGRIESFHLFPMNFEEYLLSTIGAEWIDTIKKSNFTTPLPTAIHQKLLDEVLKYMLIGGMPEVIKAFIHRENDQESLPNNWNAAQEVQQILITSFRSDFHKYASLATVEQIKKVFDAIPKLIGQKFKYSHVSKETKSRELSKALHLLEEAGLAYRVCHSSANGTPLSADENPEKFKVFFLDTGLCHRILGLPLSKLFLERKQFFVNQGALAEQFVAQELLSLTPLNQSPRLHYWHRESKSSQAEVDFVIEKEGKIIPIEVKSSHSGRMLSLEIFLKEKKLPFAMKISTFPKSHSEFSEATLETLPFYAIFQLRGA